MKTRLKSIITSIIGIFIMLSGTCMFFFGGKIVEDFTMTLMHYLTVLFVGYVFLVAKDSLIQGILCNLLKIKQPK
tara:strand:- start:1028 stop:1252 length:225 start_codon:yes stop_codon:yes gene_type:complete